MLDVRRYVTPLREGGSLPGIVEADDDGLYVLKFRGAGQGTNALVADWLGARLAQALELAAPRVALARLDGELARTEPDPEIQHLIRASHGINLAVDYLPGALGFDAATMAVDADTASRLVWLDALIENIDRSARNPNLLLWHRVLRPIDHGAAFGFHHRWDAQAPVQLDEERVVRAFAAIADHVLLPRATHIAELDAQLAARLDDGVLRAALDALPDDWLDAHGDPSRAQARRDGYRRWLSRRLAAPRGFALHAAELAARPPTPAAPPPPSRRPAWARPPSAGKRA